jgi:hypothetical protein
MTRNSFHRGIAFILGIGLAFAVVPLGQASAGPITIVPSSLSPGDWYRLAFLTSDTIDATSADIDVYNTFADGLGDLVIKSDWRAIVSTETVDARDNTGTNPNDFTGVPIFLLDDRRLADNNAHLWHLTGINRHQSLAITNTGDTVIDYVWTGTQSDGTDDEALGGFSLSGRVGRSSQTSSYWIDNGKLPQVRLYPVYAISGELKVAQPVGGLQEIEADADSEENQADGETYTGSSDLELDFDPDWDQLIAIEFDRIPVMPRATMNSVYLQFTAKTTESSANTVTIWGERNVTPEGLSSDDFDISSRSRTSQSVSWVISAWSAGDSGVDQRTPDLSAIVEEIVALPGWIPGSAMVFILDGDGTGTHTAYSEDAGLSVAPQILIDQPTADITFNFFEDTNGDGVRDVGEGSLRGAIEMYDYASGEYLDFLPEIDSTPGHITMPLSDGYGAYVTGFSGKYSDGTYDLYDKVIVSTPTGYISTYIGMDAVAADGEFNVGFVTPTNYEAGLSKVADTCYLVFDGHFDAAAETSSGRDTAVRLDLDGGLVVKETQLGAKGATGVSHIESISFNPRTGRLLAADGDELGFIDLTTGVYTELADFGSYADAGGGSVTIEDVDGMAFDPIGEIWYGFERVSGAPDRLFVFDPDLAPDDVLVVGYFGGADYVEVEPPSGDAELIDIDDGAFDARTGKLYAIANWGASPTRIVEVDVTTGATIDLGLVYFDPDGPGPIGSTPVLDMEGLGTSPAGAIYGVTGASSLLFELEITPSRVKGYMITRVLNGDGLYDIESLSCNTRAVVEIAGTVWDDLDGDGLRDGGEGEIGGVIVALLATDGSIAATTTTTVDGAYSFSGLPAGFAYTVEIDLVNFSVGAVLENRLITADSTGRLDGLGVSTLLDGATVSSDLTLDFAYAPPARPQICNHPCPSRLRSRRIGLDYIYVKFGMVLPPGFDPTKSEYVLEVESDGVPVYAGTLMAGDFTKKGHKWNFRDRGARTGSGLRDGIGWAKLGRTNHNVWPLQLKVFADVSGANSQEIRVRLMVDGLVMYDRLETWRQRRNELLFDLSH